MSFDFGSIGTAASTGAAIGSVVPGVGTAIGGTIGGLGAFFSGIFGGSTSASNSELLNKLVNLANANGVNFDSNDIVHLLPGGWGNTNMYQEDAQYIISYINNVKTGNFNAGASFGGGYLPSHSVYYNKSNDQTLSQTGGVSFTPTSNSTSSTTQSGTSSNPYVLPGVTSTAKQSYIYYYILGGLLIVSLFYIFKKA